MARRHASSSRSRATSAATSSRRTTSPAPWVVRISATELSGRQHAHDGPARAQVGEDLRGHREAGGVGLENRHEDVGAGHHRGQVRVGLEVQQHEVVGRDPLRASTPRASRGPLPSEITTTRRGMRLPQLGRRATPGCRGRASAPACPSTARLGGRATRHPASSPAALSAVADRELVDGGPVRHHGRLVGHAPRRQPIEERRRDGHDGAAPAGDRRAPGAPPARATSAPTTGRRRRAAEPIASE